MSMNEKLAEYYGTNQPDQADLEKLAAAEVAESLQETGDVSIEDLDPEALEAVAREVLEGGSEEAEEETEEEVEETEEAEEAAEETEDDESEKTAAAQFEEADFMGRVMAHALHHEMRSIAETEETEKTAGFKDMMAKAKGHGSKAWGKVKDYHKGAVSDLKGVADKSKSKKDRAKSFGKGVGKFAPHAVAAGAAGYGAKKKMEKRSSATPAFDTLVEARIAELQQESAGNKYETLHDAVDAAAKAALGLNNE